MRAENGAGSEEAQGSRLQQTLGIVAVVLLVTLVFAEGYYIRELREKIEGQEDELKHISEQLQILKTERTTLGGELAAMKKTTGGESNGNTAEGQH